MPDPTYVTIPDLTAATDGSINDNLLLEAAIPDNGSYVSRKVTKGQLVADLKEDISELGGLSDDVKTALLQIASKVAYIDDDGQTYYDALYNALYPPATLNSITAVYTQGGTVYDTDTLNSLKTDLVVTASWSDSSSTTVASSDYTLSGTLTAGTSTITVSYGGKTTTFTVEVTHYGYRLSETFVSSGSNTLDTGWAFEAGKIYSLFGEFTITSINRSNGTNHTADFMFCNKAAGNSTYVGLQIIEDKSSPYTKRIWGAGIGWNDGANLAVANHQYRFVVICDVDNASCTMALKDVTTGTTTNKSNTYTTAAFASTGKNIYLGKTPDDSVNCGFIGSCTDFGIELGTMTTAEINDYLAGE